jgi:hypothetical protein
MPKPFTYLSNLRVMVVRHIGYRYFEYRLIYFGYGIVGIGYLLFGLYLSIRLLEHRCVALYNWVFATWLFDNNFRDWVRDGCKRHVRLKFRALAIYVRIMGSCSVCLGLVLRVSISTINSMHKTGFSR